VLAVFPGRGLLKLTPAPGPLGRLQDRGDLRGRPDGRHEGHQFPRLEAPAFRRGDEKRAALGAEPAKTELTVSAPPRSSKLGGVTSHRWHSSITRLVPRPEASTARVQWKVSAIRGLRGGE